MKHKLQKIGWFLRGRYSRHSDAMQPKLRDFPHLDRYFACEKRAEEYLRLELLHAMAKMEQER